MAVRQSGHPPAAPPDQTGGEINPDWQEGPASSAGVSWGEWGRQEPLSFESPPQPRQHPAAERCAQGHRVCCRTGLQPQTGSFNATAAHRGEQDPPCAAQRSPLALLTALSGPLAAPTLLREPGSPAGKGLVGTTQPCRDPKGLRG